MNSQNKILINSFSKRENEILNRHLSILCLIAKLIVLADDQPLGQKFFHLLGRIRRYKNGFFKRRPKFLNLDCYNNLPTIIFWISQISTLHLISSHRDIFLKKKFSISKIEPSIDYTKLVIGLYVAHLGPGGAERQVVLLATKLKKAGHVVTVKVISLTGTNSHYLPILKKNGIRVELLETIDINNRNQIIYYLAKKGIDPILFQLVPNEFKDEVIKLVYNLITSHVNVLHCYLDGINIIGGWAGLICKIPLIKMSFRSYNPSNFPWFYGKYFDKYYRFFLDKKQIQLEANSHEIANDYACWLHIPKNQIDVIPNGIDIKQIKFHQRKDVRRRIRKSLGLSETDQMILCVFRLSIEKDPTSMVRCLALLKKKIPNLKAFHIGIGDELETIKELVNQLNLNDSLFFLGKKQNVIEYMQAADVLLLTSTKEGMPNVVMEAMLAGLPVVATKVGGIPELILHKKTGYLCQVGDVESMANYLSYLLTHKNEAEQMGYLAHQTISDSFSAENLLHNVINSYQKILDRNVYLKKKSIDHRNDGINPHRIMFKFLLDFLKHQEYPSFQQRIAGKWTDNYFVKKFILETKIKKLFIEKTGYQLNLKDPKTYNEKLQWLKLNVRDPLITKCADKYLVRDYITQTIGKKYLIKLVKCYDSTKEIDFNELPKSFVLKVNWGSGTNIICPDKNKLNWPETIRQLDSWLLPKANHFFDSYEWCYKDIKPKILCEKYIKQFDGNLLDYKFLCFHGQPKYIWADIDRFGYHRRNFYDLEWNSIDNLELKYPKDPKVLIPRPPALKKMIEIATKLAQPFKHVRVDLYNLNGRIYFGELTFYSGSGFEIFKPLKWDHTLGKLIRIT